MRIALAAGVLLLTAAACGSGQQAAAPASSTPPLSAPASSTPALKVFGWGESGTSSGVDIRVDAPTTSTEQVIGVDGKPDPKFKYISLPITATNKSAGQATIAVWARIGQKEASVGDEGPGKLLPGENGTLKFPIKIDAGATGDLTLEVYANVDGQPAKNRLAFKGPLP